MPTLASLKARAYASLDEKFLQPAKLLDDHEIAYAVAVGFWNGLLPLPGLTVPSQLFVLLLFGRLSAKLSMTPVQFTLSFGMHLVTGMSGLEILMSAAPSLVSRDVPVSCARINFGCTAPVSSRSGALLSLGQLALCCRARRAHQLFRLRYDGSLECAPQAHARCLRTKRSSGAPLTCARAPRSRRVL